MIPFGLRITLPTVGGRLLLADTVYVSTAPTGFHGWVQVIADIATIVIALALIILAIAMLLAAWNSRRLFAKVHQVVEQLRGDVNPILKHVQDVSDNLNYISASIRTDVDGLRQTLQRSQEGLIHAAGVAERRMNDFNALLEVAQEEAEHMFIHTASTIRGVRAGASAFQDARRPERQGPEQLSRPHEEVPDL